MHYLLSTSLWVFKEQEEFYNEFCFLFTIFFFCFSFSILFSGHHLDHWTANEEKYIEFDTFLCITYAVVITIIIIRCGSCFAKVDRIEPETQSIYILQSTLSCFQLVFSSLLLSLRFCWPHPLKPEKNVLLLSLYFTFWISQTILKTFPIYKLPFLYIAHKTE